MNNQDVTSCCCLVLFASVPDLFGAKARSVYTLEQMNFTGPGVGAKCADYVSGCEGLMRLLLLAVIGVTLLCTF